MNWVYIIFCLNMHHKESSVSTMSYSDGLTRGDSAAVLALLLVLTLLTFLLAADDDAAIGCGFFASSISSLKHVHTTAFNYHNTSTLLCCTVLQFGIHDEIVWFTEFSGIGNPSQKRGH